MPTNTLRNIGNGSSTRPHRTNRQGDPAFREIVAKIVSDHRTSLGVIDWSGAFAAHPDWKRELRWHNHKSQQSAYQLASLFRHDPAKHAQALGTSPMPEASAPALEPVPASSPGLPPADNRRSLLETIAKQYGHLEKVPYKEIWATHPEWKEALKANSLHGTRMVYSGVAAVCRRLGLRQLTSPKSHHKKVQEVPQAPPPPPPAPPAPVLRFCPQCGTNLHMFHTAFAIARKHTPAQ